MLTFFPPLIIDNPLTSRRQRGTWIERMTAGRRAATGRNVYVLKDDYAINGWPKVGFTQPPSWDWVDKLYSGGSTYIVTIDEAALLASIGLSVDEVADPLTPPTPIEKTDPVSGIGLMFDGNLGLWWYPSEED